MNLLLNPVLSLVLFLEQKKMYRFFTYLTKQFLCPQIP